MSDIIYQRQRDNKFASAVANVRARPLAEAGTLEKIDAYVAPPSFTTNKNVVLAAGGEPTASSNNKSDRRVAAHNSVPNDTTGDTELTPAKNNNSQILWFAVVTVALILIMQKQ